MTNEVNFGKGCMTCVVNDGFVRLQMNYENPQPKPIVVGNYVFFELPPDEALRIIERMRSCLYEIAAAKEDEPSE